MKPQLPAVTLTMQALIFRITSQAAGVKHEKVLILKRLNLLKPNSIKRLYHAIY